MLSYAAPAAQLTGRPRRPQTRRAMPQLHLNFTDLPVPEERLWEQLNDEPKQIVVEALARLIVKAARAENKKEPTHD
jgi:hypothetical protein